jgi:Protein of unknown function (DUF4230)
MGQSERTQLVLMSAAIILFFALLAVGGWFLSQANRAQVTPGITTTVAATNALRPTQTATSSRTATSTSTPPPTRTPTHTPTATPTFTSTPTPTPTPRVITIQVQSLGKLETAKFMMQTVVDRQRVPNSIWDQVFGTDKLLLVAEGEVVAGFDMTQVSKQDIIVAGDRVAITLPAPQILYSKIDSDKTYVYERKTGLFQRPDKDIETEARRLAEQAMVEHALEGGILKQAETFGRLQVEAFLRSLGFTQVILSVKGS